MNQRKIILLAIIAIVLAAFFYFDLVRFLTLEALKANRGALVEFYQSRPWAVSIIFLAIYIVQTAFSLPGAAVLSLAAGALFGLLRGVLLVNLGATLGATLAFLFARYLFRDLVVKKFGSPHLDKLNTEVENQGYSYLLFLRLVPLFPFFLINLGAALTSIPLRMFFLTTMFGIIPGSVVYVNAGASLAAIETLGDVTSPRVLFSFGLLGLFALLPVFYDKLKKKSVQKNR
jgi:uncharacterized membrane protein YdjX (TVP38/TMEM64 family)